MTKEYAKMVKCSSSLENRQQLRARQKSGAGDLLNLVDIERHRN